MASQNSSLLFLVPTPESLGPTSLCLCRKIVWVQDKSIFYAFSPLSKNEADTIMKFRVPISASVVNGTDLLTSVNAKLVGVQQVLGHVVKPNIQQPVLIQPNRLSSTQQTPTIQSPITVDKQMSVKKNGSGVYLIDPGANKQSSVTPKETSITPKETATIPQESATTATATTKTSEEEAGFILASSNMQGKTRHNVATTQVISNQKTSVTKSSCSNKLGNSTSGNNQLKIKFLWNKTGSSETSETSHQKSSLCGKDTSQSEERVQSKIPKETHISITQEKHVLKPRTVNPKDIEAQERTLNTTQVPERIQITCNKSLRVTLPKLNSTSLKRLGCNKSSHYLHDIERKEKKHEALRTKKSKQTIQRTKKCKQTFERPQRLTSLTHHPDFKHIPTNDKITFLKDLLQSQRSYLGM